MRKIIVAGAGHGGLVAAWHLAESGYDVTVIESKSRQDIGYEWHDCIYKPTFDEAGITLPPCDGRLIMPYPDMAYFNPRKSVKLDMGETSRNLLLIDRKLLVNMLVEKCENAGVNFVFETAVTGAIVDRYFVTGVRTASGNYCGDLVIDSAGIDSPVRSSLPPKSGIPKNIPGNKTFYSFRAYYENTDGTLTDPAQSIYFFHCGKPGMDWVATDKNYIDVLVGSFNELHEEDITDAVDDFRNDFPCMGKMIQGGTVQKIPLSSHLPKFVWNGYAAVGDSCSMIEPMSGSGIDRSIKSGGILAETVTDAGNKAFSEELLWKYQYRSIKETGERYYNDDILRDFMSGLSAGDIDSFLEKRIITEKEISGRGVSDYTFSEILKKISALIPEADKLPGFIKMGAKNIYAGQAKKALPAVYSSSAYSRWLKIYSKI